VEKVPVHDPAMAKKNVEVGDFYYKRENFKAAEERYRLAVEHNKQWVEAYEKLIKAMERQGDLISAIRVCELYLENNPDSKKIEDFKKRVRELQEKLR
jgi:outer membrane protein assembly factor BamD (BamD/ComL family)